MESTGRNIKSNDSFCMIIPQDIIGSLSYSAKTNQHIPNMLNRSLESPIYQFLQSIQFTDMTKNIKAKQLNIPFHRLRSENMQMFGLLS